MGSSLSVCGFGASDGEHDAQLYHQSKDFARNFDRSVAERKRSLSTTTDSPVASILSNSDRLIPDAFLPKDIQVLSQRRQSQQHHHHHSKNSSMGSSRVSNSSYRGVGFGHVVRNAAAKIPGSVNKKYEFGIKTASSSFGYSDDESNNPVLVSSAVACLPRVIK